MKTLNLPELNNLPEESVKILNEVKSRIGRIPNLYATIGYSPAGLKGMLDFESLLGQEDVFSPKEREAVNLIVSQVNKCDYCLAAHTALAKMRGFSEEDTIAIRKAEYNEQKLNTVIKLAASIAENKGNAPQEFLNSFFLAGYDEKALIDLIGLITVRTFTNYVFVNSSIEIDFPEAQAI